MPSNQRFFMPQVVTGKKERQTDRKERERQTVRQTGSKTERDRERKSAIKIPGKLKFV
jgi:hypothetical protein